LDLFAHCPPFLEVDLISSRLQPDRLSRADCSTQINRRALKMRAPEPIKRKMALFSGFPGVGPRADARFAYKTGLFSIDLRASTRRSRSESFE
jgi:hypothetical protein